MSFGENFAAAGAALDYLEWPVLGLIEPAVWETNKSEALDPNSEFWWIDDDPYTGWRVASHSRLRKSAYRDQHRHRSRRIDAAYSNLGPACRGKNFLN